MMVGILLSTFSTLVVSIPFLSGNWYHAVDPTITPRVSLALEKVWQKHAFFRYVLSTSCLLFSKHSCRCFHCLGRNEFVQAVPAVQTRPFLKQWKFGYHHRCCHYQMIWIVNDCEHHRLSLQERGSVLFLEAWSLRDFQSSSLSHSCLFFQM